MALLEAFRTEKALHLRDSVTGRMQALITIHDQFFHDGTGLVAVEEPARLDGVEGFARKADRMRHIIRYGDNGTRRWYPRRSALNEYIEFGRPEYWTETQWSLLPMGTPTVTDSKLVWDRATYALTVQHNWHRVKLDVTLKSSAAARRIRWPVTVQGLVRSGDNLISQSDGKIVGYINKPTAFDSTTPQPKAIPVTMSYSAGYVEFNADLTGAVYPVVIDPTFTDGYGGDATTYKDAGIEKNFPTTNFGSGAELDMLSSPSPNGFRRGLAQWDVSSISPTATVTSGVATFTCRATNGNNDAVNLHAVTAAWTESQVTWNNRITGTAWGTAGGDYNASVAGTRTAAWTANTAYDFDITALVQSWVDGTLANNGLLGKAASEVSTVLAGMVGYSSDHATTGYRPYLTVVYVTEGAIAKNVNEILQLVEANRRVFAFRRPLAEIVQVAEARSRNLTMTRNKAETINLIESSNARQSLLRRLAETINIVETQGKGIATALLKIISETVQLLEAKARNLSLSRAKSEMIDLAELTQASRSLLRRLAEGLTIVETGSSALGMVRRLSETVQIIETSNRSITIGLTALVKFVSENLRLIETSGRNLTLRRASSETVQISEKVTSLRSLCKSVAETLQISETAYKAARWLRLVSETMQIGESVSRIRGFFKTIAETLQIIEASNHAFRQAQALVKYASETLQLLEVASRVKRPLGHLSIDIQRGYARIQVVGRLLRIWHDR